jgi:Flp pilus assembly protein TadG
MNRLRDCAGQSLMEFALIAFMLLVLIFGIIDIGRAIYQRQIMINLSREGANLTSRGTSLTNALDSLVISAAPLDINRNGLIVLTAVQRKTDGTLVVLEQRSTGALTNSVLSRVAPGGTGSTAVTLPNTDIPQPSRILNVAEIFYNYTAVTPLGQLMGFTLPSRQYDVAYF